MATVLYDRIHVRVYLSRIIEGGRVFTPIHRVDVWTLFVNFVNVLAYAVQYAAFVATWLVMKAACVLLVVYWAYTHDHDFSGKMNGLVKQVMAKFSQQQEVVVVAVAKPVDQVTQVQKFEARMQRAEEKKPLVVQHAYAHNNGTHKKKKGGKR